MRITRLRTILQTISVLSLLFIGSGCLKQGLPFYYYTLNPAQSAMDSTTSVLPKELIGPIHLPPFLDQGQIISRSSPYSVHIEEQRRWAGELSTMIQNVIHSNLIATHSVPSIFPYPAPSEKRLYQIPLDFLHFERDADGTAFIVVRWKILSKDATVVQYNGVSSYRISPDDQSFEALAKSLSIGLGKLSLEIATQLQSVSATQGISQ